MRLNNKNDTRVKITFKMLELSFTCLSKEKPIRTITVQELCERAHIPKSTFYLHFQNFEDFLSYVEQKLYDNMSRFLNENCCRFMEKEDQLDYYGNIFRFFKSNVSTESIVFDIKDDERFLSKLFNEIKSRQALDYQTRFPNVSQEDTELASAFIAAGCIGLLREWMGQDMKQPIHKIITILNNLILMNSSYMEGH